MKILIFTKSFPENSFIGGAEIQAFLLAKYLSSKNHQIDYLTSSKEEIGKEKKVENFNVIYLTNPSKGIIKFLAEFYKICKAKSPDIFFIRDFRYLFIANLICKKLKIPIIYNTTHINNCLPHPKKIKKTLNISIILNTLKFAIQHYLNFKTLKKVNVLTINKYHAQLLKEKYNICATPIYNSMEDSYLKNQVRIKENNVIWVANLKTRKRPELFIKLANELKNTSYKFIIIGYIQNNIKFYKKLIAETEKNNPNFKYLGGLSVQEVDKILAKSKIFINTCQPEGFGNNFIQAWLNECPTVTLDFDPDNIIKNNNIGFHSKSFEQLVKDVKYLIDNPQKSKEMGQRARHYAIINHIPAVNIPKYETYLNNILYK